MTADTLEIKHYGGGWSIIRNEHGTMRGDSLVANDVASLVAEAIELRARIAELEETLLSYKRGEVDRG